MVIQAQDPRGQACFKSWVCNLSITKPVSSHLISLNFSFFCCKRRRKNYKIFRPGVSPWRWALAKFLEPLRTMALGSYFLTFNRRSSLKKRNTLTGLNGAIENHVAPGIFIMPSAFHVFFFPETNLGLKYLFLKLHLGKILRKKSIANYRVCLISLFVTLREIKYDPAVACKGLHNHPKNMERISS